MSNSEGGKSKSGIVVRGLYVNPHYSSAEKAPHTPENIPLLEIISSLPKAQRERLISGYDLKSFARIFEDEEIMAAVDGFFKYGMNVSETARSLYMHRNTLIYRLNKIKKTTGLDIRVFDMAVTFEILRILYELK